MLMKNSRSSSHAASPWLAVLSGYFARLSMVSVLLISTLLVQMVCAGPTVTTLDVTGIGESSLTFNGTVNPNGCLLYTSDAADE